ncbi:MAG: ABC transporter permease [Bryobacteraceae bacterium]|nr:ABC transporter permease [Bryobacteraceae bacterium]
MIRRLRDWLDETHGSRFELARLFWGAFFSGGSEIWIRTAGGVLAIVGSLWILLAPALIRKYAELQRLGAGGLLASEFAADQNTLTIACMLATAMVTGVLWRFVYPQRLDYYALAGFPVRPAEIFAAKFAALALVFCCFIGVLTGQAAAVLSAIASGPSEPPSFLTVFAAMAACCALVFFALISLQGLMLLALPVRMFESASAIVQAVVIGVSVAALPFSASLSKSTLPYAASNPFWLGAPLLALLVYGLSYRRYGRQLLESPRARSKDRDISGWLIEKWIPCPREQAMLLFIVRTLLRSRAHRHGVLVCAALALAWVGKSAGDVFTVRTVAERAALSSVPLTLIVFAMLGVRHLFSRPVDLEANWLLQLTEREGRRAWMQAVERFCLWLVAAPLTVFGALAVASSQGLAAGAAWGALGAFASLIAFEWIFREWRKAPFACSRLASGRPLLITFTMAVGLASALTPCGYLLLGAARNPIPFCIALGSEAFLWRALRRHRVRQRGVAPLQFQDDPDAAVDMFHLSGEPSRAAHEEYQRAMRSIVNQPPEAPLIRPLDSGESLRTRLLEWCAALPGDLRYAARALLRSPGFLLGASGTLALGLALNAAFFTVFSAVALKPTGIRDPARVVSVEFQTSGGRSVSLSAGQFTELQPRMESLSEIASYTLVALDVERVTAKVEVVSANYFSMLGVAASAGRLFKPGESAAVAVLSHRSWTRRFGRASSVIGREISIGGNAYSVIGVASEEFAGLDKFSGDVWVPLEAYARLPGSAKQITAHIVGRLRPGTTLSAASQFFAARARAVTDDRSPNRIARAILETTAVPLANAAFRFVVPVLIAFALTMAIPCANAANMMLARALLRRREIGIRLSLGASRGRVVRQLLAEGLVVAFVSAIGGLALARLLLELTLRFVTSTAPPTALLLFTLPDLSLNAHVYLAMTFCACLTALLFALAPAAQVSRQAAQAALRGEFGGWRSSNFRDALIVGQVAMCTLLLIVSALLLQGTAKPPEQELGYDAAGVYGVGFDGVSNETYREVHRKLREQPWAATIAFMKTPPTAMRSLQIGRDGDTSLTSYYNVVSPGYFALLRIPLVQGRTFSEHEASAGAPAVIVSQSVAARLWPGQVAIGKTLALGDDRGFPFREAAVVGVCRDIVANALRSIKRPSVYFPGTLLPTSTVAVWARGRFGDEDTGQQMERMLSQMADRTLRPTPLREWVDWTIYPLQAASWLLTLLAGVALLLTLSGMYAGVSYAASHRLKEIGIRIALGATRIGVAAFILRYAAALAGVGLAIGGVLALGAAKYLAAVGTVINFARLQPYLLGFAIVMGTALVAALAPMRRASSTEPMSVIRSE